MKKIYLFALALSIGFTSFGQNKNNSSLRGQLEEAYPENTFKPTIVNDKTPGQVIWSEDFTGGFPAGWTKGGATNNGADWVIDPNTANIVATFTNTAGVASTSGGNYMLYFGETIAPIADRDAWFQTDGIQLNGAASFTVRFEQKFRLCCASAAALDLEVSTDSTFATGVFSYTARNGFAINSIQGNTTPETKSINITDGFGGSSAKIFLRFHWNLGASHYFWMIDDISVIETVDNDLSTSQEYYGAALVPYTRIPAAQVSPIDFSLQATNVGATSQTNTVLTVDINAGTFTGTSSATTITALALGGSTSSITDSLFSTTSFTPPASPIGVPYNVTLTVASDSSDNTPTNNTFAFNPFEVTDSTYAQDDYGVVPNLGDGGGNSTVGGVTLDEFEAGNYYDIYAKATATSIEIVVGDGTDAGVTIEAMVYEIDANGDFLEIVRSTTYTLLAGDGEGTVLNFDLPVNTLDAGKFYFAGVHSFGGGLEFNYATSGRSPDQSSKGGPTSLIYYPSMSSPTTGRNFFTSRTPMIRLNVKPNTVGVNEIDNKVSFSVFPNPSNGVFNIDLASIKGNTAQLSVKNIVGQTIINKTINVSGNTKETISLADYSKGIYFLTIANETVKLIVE